MSKLITHLLLDNRGDVTVSRSNMLWNLFLRKHNQRKNAEKLKINTPNSVVEQRFVKIGGIDQWITIRGENRDNPILFFIHGGPGSTCTIFNPLIRSWERFFTIVQWDQRGAGKTFGRNKQEGSIIINFDRLVQDGIEIAEYLCAEFSHPKIILVGSSVGSLTGTMMAKHRPDLFYAYVGTDQNSKDPDNLSYQWTLDALLAIDNTKAVQLIKKMGPDRSKWTRKDFDQMNQYLVKCIKDVPNMIMDLILPSMLSSPDHKIQDIVDIFKGMNYSLDHLFEELLSFDYSRLGTTFELPFFVFQGDSDIITPTALAKSYFDEIESPHKEFVLIKNAGHLACFARPNQFLDELVKRVRPFILL